MAVGKRIRPGMKKRTIIGLKFDRKNQKSFVHFSAGRRVCMKVLMSWSSAGDDEWLRPL